MTLGQTQRKFALCIAKLIIHMNKRGYEVRIADAYRNPRVFGMPPHNKPEVYGHPNSNHKRFLAVDLDLFLDGDYCEKTEDHAEFGKWWEELGEKEDLPLRWGGAWQDGNHYTVLWKGQR